MWENIRRDGNSWAISSSELSQRSKTNPSVRTRERLSASRAWVYVRVAGATSERLAGASASLIPWMVRAAIRSRSDHRAI